MSSQPSPFNRPHPGRRPAVDYGNHPPRDSHWEQREHDYERRSFDERQLLRAPPRSTETDSLEYEDELSFSDDEFEAPHRQPREAPTVPFHIAAKSLFRALEDGYRCFQGYTRDFEEDIKRIREYSEPGIVDHIWQCKVKFVSRQQTTRQGGHGDDDRQDDRDHPSSRFRKNPFRVHSDNIAKYLYEVVNSPPPRRESGTSQRQLSESAKREDSIKWIKSKLGSMQQEVADHLQVARRSYAQAHPMLKELGLVRAILQDARDLWDQPVTDRRDERDERQERFRGEYDDCEERTDEHGDYAHSNDGWSN